MPEAKASKTKTKTKNGKKKKNGKSPKKNKPKSPVKKLPPSRRNEIWETLSDDLSETPSSPTDVIVELEDWSDNEEDIKEPLTNQPQSSRLYGLTCVEVFILVKMKTGLY